MGQHTVLKSNMNVEANEKEKFVIGVKLNKSKITAVDREKWMNTIKTYQFFVCLVLIPWKNISVLNRVMNTLGGNTENKPYAVHLVTESHPVSLSLLVRLAPHCPLISHSPCCQPRDTTGRQLAAEKES